ncbi:exodeoxyribonuclease VII large subunit [Desulfobulbus sp.]|uniref:exodeoxyribonuclease VII large subunit n=1 Tax=Desulfobulbus sp. TaxID=895 RepID=UPI00286F39F4|nr:exodeoxyribonuclease VII large subunit [Desulfobulbus sp.]
MDDRRVLTVTELNSSIRTLLEGRFPFVSVAGEISNLHRPSSGHLYFTLKDAGAQIRTVLFKMQQRYLAQPPKDGMHVVCRGRISVYEPRGEYQLIADTLELQGAGALHEAFEALKRRLAAEGLFDEHVKRPLPPFPAHITLITSPQGAAVHDFIRIATRRFPPIRIAVYPATMQGDRAAAEVGRAIEIVNARLATDLIVLCRGGGSTEDLWAFNDETLARMIRASTVPVVSAIGHEIDFTIADLAADFRAPTPSGAAELLVPDGEALRVGLARLQAQMCRNLRHGIDRNEQRLRLARQRLMAMPYPLDRLRLRLDQLHARLDRGLNTLLAERTHRFNQTVLRLAPFHPGRLLALREQQLHGLGTRLVRAVSTRIRTGQEQLARTAGILQAVSPLATLARGYAIVRTSGKKQRLVTEAAQVRPGDELTIMLRRGQLACRVERSEDGTEQPESGEQREQEDDQSRAASTF